MSLIPSFFGTGRRINFFDRFATPSSTSTTCESATINVNSRIDWKETPEAHVFKVDLPGLKKGEVKVEILGGRVVQISGNRSNEKKEKNCTWHRMERSSGCSLRQFKLPENSKMDQVKAFMENGVLTVTVPKEELKKPHLKLVHITA